jgi:tetratricopeptide (TPR) repeat protein
VAAAAVIILIPALVVLAAVSFDPWAVEGCPRAADQGADCLRYGMAGRAYIALTLSKVDGELQSGEWTAAQANLKSILALRPNDAAAIDARGQAEAGLGDTAAALSDYDRALKLGPDDLEIHSRRGQLYQSLGKTEQAAADFAVIYHADRSTPGQAGLAALIREVDHSTTPPKAHKPAKRRRQPSEDAAPPPEKAPETEPAAAP